MPLQEFSHMDRWRAEDKRDYESKLEAIRNSDSGIKLAKLRDEKKQTDTSGLDEESYVNSKKLGDIPQNEVSRISGKVPKSQEVWDKFLCKLEEEEVSLEEIIGCEDRKQFIADSGFAHTEAAIIETQWKREIQKAEKQTVTGIHAANASENSDLVSILTKQSIEVEEIRHWPHLASWVIVENELASLEKQLKDEPSQTLKELQEAFDGKITSKGLSRYDACCVNYLLSDDPVDRLRLAHLILNRECAEDRIKLHNFRTFNKLGTFPRKGKEGQALEYVDTPLFPTEKRVTTPYM
eukprot:Tbor_TRINITY_DN5712_c0_g3::TRINITY_DN5712_c0_g3_i2::g.19951::m.19951